MDVSDSMAIGGLIHDDVINNGGAMPGGKSKTQGMENVTSSHSKVNVMSLE